MSQLFLLLSLCQQLWLHAGAKLWVCEHSHRTGTQAVAEKVLSPSTGYVQKECNTTSKCHTFCMHFIVCNKTMDIMWATCCSSSDIHQTSAVKDITGKCILPYKPTHRVWCPIMSILSRLLGAYHSWRQIQKNIIKEFLLQDKQAAMPSIHPSNHSYIHTHSHSLAVTQTLWMSFHDVVNVIDTS